MLTTLNVFFKLILMESLNAQQFCIITKNEQDLKIPKSQLDFDIRFLRPWI